MSKFNSDDFERVMRNIAIDTSRNFSDSMVRLGSGWNLWVRFGEPAPQFMPRDMASSIGMPLKDGDIVRCFTNPEHHWGISVLAQQLGNSEWLLQEIGGESRLKMSNEDLYVLRFMIPERLYTGHQYKIYRWVKQKAFSERYNKKADEYFKRCGGVEFDGDDLIIWCRPHVLGLDRKVDGVTLYAQPKKFVMKWNERTRLKDIVSTMCEQGFGDDFEYAEEEPKIGMGGMAKLTKDDIDRIVLGY